MLDPHTYRASEHFAKSLIPSWRISQIHNLDHFERVGFPVRLATLRELGQIVDTMQENRFASYMEELGGLSEAEHDLMLEACRDMAKFQLTYLPQREPVLPVSTLISALAIYKKIQGFNRDFRTVLEIGPGCGYVSFFMRQHASLENYSQIEACESFYILQNLVNVHCFGIGLDERALPPATVSALDYFVNQRPDMELSPALKIGDQRARCTHYPWWKIGEIASRERRFEVVTSNANLLEFNSAALDDYLTLINRSLDPEGVFLVQCTGFPANGTVTELLDALYAKEFAPLMFVCEKVPAEFPGAPSRSVLDQFNSASSGGKRIFTTNNAVFVRRGHPLFEKYYDRKNYHMHFIANEPIVESMFFARPPGLKSYSLDHFVQETEKAIQDLMRRPLPGAGAN